jgi:hypothetical protein
MADVDAYSFARVVYIAMSEGRNENRMARALQLPGVFQPSWKHGCGLGGQGSCRAVLSTTPGRLGGSLALPKDTMLFSFEPFYTNRNLILR